MRTALSLLLIPAVLCATDPMIHIPLSLRDGRPRTAVDNLFNAERTRTRYALRNSSDMNARNRRIEQRATVATIPLIDQQSDSSYYCTISIGTPGQLFDLELDLGSPASWVADSSCSASDGCTSSMQFYDASRSSTSTEVSFLGTITYGSENVSGSIIKDTVRLGPYVVSSQVFLAANEMSTNLVPGSISGVLGLTYGSVFSGDGTSFLQSLLSNGELGSGEMSFWLNRLAGTGDAQQEAPGGAFTLGGTNASLYSGDIEFLTAAGSPTTTENWMLVVEDLTVQGKSVEITAGPSALATFDVSVPAAVPSIAHPGFFQFPCTTKIDISISFGGRSWPINPVDMNLGPIAVGSSQCFGAIYELSPGITAVNTTGGPNWVIGATFLRFQTHPIFDWIRTIIDAAAAAPKSPVAPGPPSIPPHIQSHVDAEKLHDTSSPITSHVEYFRTSTVSSGRIEPPSLTRSLSIMKQEQTAAAHYRGSSHTASDVLVRTSDGLQLSPGFETQESGSWPGQGNASGIGVADGIQEVHRASHVDAGAGSGSGTKKTQDDDADSVSPPTYQRYAVN
ncbi:aspartic peptidase domain-containing protein [Mycena capillaripes]|nr:aspartic peptidase domain-containing protein [Mycena capillaripes]